MFASVSRVCACVLVCVCMFVSVSVCVCKKNSSCLRGVKEASNVQKERERDTQREQMNERARTSGGWRTRRDEERSGEERDVCVFA